MRMAPECRQYHQQHIYPIHLKTWGTSFKELLSLTGRVASQQNDSLEQIISMHFFNNLWKDGAIILLDIALNPGDRTLPGHHLHLPYQVPCSPHPRSGVKLKHIFKITSSVVKVSYSNFQTSLWWRPRCKFFTQVTPWMFEIFMLQNINVNLNIGSD